MPDDTTSLPDARTSSEGTQQTDSHPLDTGTDNTGSQTEDSSSTTTSPQQQTTDALTSEGAPAPPNPWETDENPYRKRFNDVLGNGQRLYQELQTVRKQYEGIEPEIARKALEQQKHRESMASLKPWNKGHDGYDKFQTVRSRVSEFGRMRQAADTPEKQNLLREMGGSMFAPEELNLVQEYEQDRAKLISQFTEDPRGFLGELVAPLIQQEISKFEQFQKASTQTTQWFNDPGNQPLLDRYAPDMYRHMDPSVPSRDKAIEVARLKAENDALKARLMASSETEATAQAQIAARSRSATGATRRNTPSVGITDPYQYVLKQGYKPGTTEFAMALHKLNNQG